MNWKEEAINELKNYPKIRNSITNITERIQILEARETSIRGSATDSTPVHGGGNRYEDNLINCIAEKSRLIPLLEINKMRAAVIEKGLAVLTDNERKVIKRFYFDGMKFGAAVDCLREEIGYEEAQINRIRNAAIYHYTIAEFGLPEL